MLRMKTSAPEFDAELHHCTQLFPREGDLVRFFFPDGQIAYGFWDGEDWRLGLQVVQPEYWQDLSKG